MWSQIHRNQLQGLPKSISCFQDSSLSYTNENIEWIVTTESRNRSENWRSANKQQVEKVKTIEKRRMLLIYNSCTFSRIFLYSLLTAHKKSIMFFCIDKQKETSMHKCMYVSNDNSKIIFLKLLEIIYFSHQANIPVDLH